MVEIKKFDGIFEVLLLAVCFMLYGLNFYMDLVLLVFIVSIFVVTVNKDVFLAFYFALMFFEAVLTLPYDLGSVFRIYQLVFFAKVLWEIKSARLAVPSVQKIVLGVVLVVWAGVSGEEISSMISMAINVFMLIYISSYYNASKHKDENYAQMLFVMFLFAFLSGFYGLYNGRELFYGSSYSRLSGTMGDPNYSALFYLFGIFSLLGSNIISNGSIRCLLIGILSIFVLATVSLTGIIGLVLLGMIYCLIKNTKMAVALFLLMSFIIFVLSLLQIESGPLYGIKLRIEFSVNSIIDGNYAALTSDRSKLFEDYETMFQDQSAGAKLLGGKNIIAGREREDMLALAGTVSHNSFIDMLFAVGIIGTFYILSYIVYDITRYLRNYKMTRNEYYLSLVLLKLTLLWFSMGLSLFPLRYFLVYLFL